ncbi:hypothetical protein B0H12DRAFT_1077795 [Mycena haematopus]|nr:hypothetical protein B0H12DRAFT_1077795 [Mycena haematopus]
MPSTPPTPSQLDPTPPPSLMHHDSDSDADDFYDYDLLKGGDVIRTECDTTALLTLYERGSKADVDHEQDNPLLNLQALQYEHPVLSHFTRQHPRRSPRLQEQKREADSAPLVEGSQKKKRKMVDPAPLAKGSRKKRKVEDISVPKISDARTLKWMHPDGILRIPGHQWSICRSTTVAAIGPAPPPPPTPAVALVPAPKPRMQHPKPSANRAPRRGGKKQKHKDGSVNLYRDAALAKRHVSSGDVYGSPTFTLLHDASVSPKGFQGRKPPPTAREMIDTLFHKLPDGEALDPLLQHFIRIPYVMATETTKERATFVLDKDDHMFFHRTSVAKFLVNRVPEIEEAQAILLGDDLVDVDIRLSFKDAARGPHLANIIGHHRQSAKVGSFLALDGSSLMLSAIQKPRLTAWHVANLDRVNRFLALPIIKQIMRVLALSLTTIRCTHPNYRKFVSGVIRIAFPGIAARFEKDAEWHFQRYGIRPMFGYFWNFCWNAVFPGQARVHAFPHADYKNQVGVCSILTYITKSGGLEVVYTALDVDKPTPQNSTPAVPGDEAGRGSIVFFNQATMRHGPVTGSDTLKEAGEAGHSCTTDYGTDINVAFRKFGVRSVVPQEVRDRMGDLAPNASDFGL